uniref:Uncharacterized protein n=1 Tax=Onchocerca volvulus TaxID=6282 RepID=A0A8R1TML4_ONCVO
MSLSLHPNQSCSSKITDEPCKTFISQFGSMLRYSCPFYFAPLKVKNIRNKLRSKDASIAMNATYYVFFIRYGIHDMEYDTDMLNSTLRIAARQMINKDKCNAINRYIQVEKQAESTTSYTPQACPIDGYKSKVASIL